MNEIHELDKLMPTPVGVNIICVGYSEKTNVVIIFYLSLYQYSKRCFLQWLHVFCEMGDLSDFQNGQIMGAHLAGEFVLTF